jgi:uncharacterized protein
VDPPLNESSSQTAPAPPLNTAWIVALCLPLGATASLLGIGGGIFLVPFLIHAARVDERAARGTSLGLVSGIATFGFLSTWVLGGVAPRWEIFLLVTPFSILVARQSAKWMKHLPLTLVRRLFAVVVLLAGLRLVASIPAVQQFLGLDTGDGGVFVYETGPALLVLPVLGALVGLIGPLVGIGGGLLLIPLLDFLFIGLPFGEIRSTVLLIVAPTALFGFLKHLEHGTADASWVKRLIVPSVLGSLGGSRIAVWIGAKALQGVFGLFLFVVGASMMATSFLPNRTARA